jgi:hypothetical protein
MGMRIEVTGGGESPGSHLCERLVVGGCEVLRLDELSGTVHGLGAS